MAHRLPPAGKKSEQTDHFMFYHVVDMSKVGSKCSREPPKVHDPGCMLKPKFSCKASCQQPSRPERHTAGCKCYICTRRPQPASQSPPRPAPQQPQCEGQRFVCWPVPDPKSGLCPMVCERTLQGGDESKVVKRNNPDCPRPRPKPQPQQKEQTCHCVKRLGNYKVECCCKISEIPRQQC